MHPAGAYYKIRGIVQYQSGEDAIIFVTGCLLVRVLFLEFDEVVCKLVNERLWICNRLSSR